MQVLVLDAAGKALSATTGLATAGELQQSLQTAVASFHKQQVTRVGCLAMLTHCLGAHV